MARKNANGEGSRPRLRADGRWEARYWKDGKRRSVYGKTRKEVADKLNEALTHKDDQPTFVLTGITVREFFAQYEQVARDTMKKRSYETVQYVTRIHLLPALGHYRLKDLTREGIQRLLSQQLHADLSPGSVRRIHGALSSVLNTAVRWRYIERNPCYEVSKPRVAQPEIRPFSLDEAKRFLAAAEGDRYEALFVLGLTSGARWGN